MLKYRITQARKHGLEVFIAYIERDGELVATTQRMSETAARQWAYAQIHKLSNK